MATNAARRLADAVLSPLRAFLHAEAAGGVVLLAAAVTAVVLANTGAAATYSDFWIQKVNVGAGGWALSEDLRHWVNDGLMVVFFFVVGLEIKRELVVGELREPRVAVLPAVAALGGALLPAALYLLIAGSGEAAGGWGVPMATDIAFAVGVLALLGARVSTGAKLFLLSVAIVDDLLAIVVIAVFYSADIDGPWLVVACLGLLAVLVQRRAGVTSPWAYVPAAVVVWGATLESGVHATLAGVVLGLLTPARPIRGRAVLEELEHTLHPVSAFLVVPVFAFANAGVDLRGEALRAAFAEPVTWGVAVGLVAGKTAGIATVANAARRLGLGMLPGDMHPKETWGVAAMGGVGFTVALFVTDLAFTDPELLAHAKVGIFTGSIAAAVLGVAALMVTPAGQQADPRPRPRVKH
jgi:Na+:H+ antiporter, NhaA family